MTNLPKLEIVRTTKKTDKVGTMGNFLVNKEKRADTLEPPWIPVKGLDGGKTEKSCIPKGKYELIPFKSTKYGLCFLMQNIDLDVIALKEDILIKGQRYLCIFSHRGSYVRNFIGCIGTGEKVLGDYMITNTRTTCREIMTELYAVKRYMNIQENLTLTIRWKDD